MFNGINKDQDIEFQLNMLPLSHYFNLNNIPIP